MVISVNVLEDDEGYSSKYIHHEKITQLVRTALKKHQMQHGSIDVYFVTCNTMRQLNIDHRSKNKVSDVLSFQIEPPANQSVTGSVHLCTAQIRLDLKETTLEIKIMQLILHGVLHILGFTHDHDHDGDIMEREELELQQQLGITHHAT